MRSFASIRVTRGLSNALRFGVLLVTLVLLTNTFVAIGWLRPVVVVGDSMAPTFEPGERVLVRRWRTPQRWDVVVLQSTTGEDALLVKRVVGMPGETVTLLAGGVWADSRRVLPENQHAAASVYYGAFGAPEWRLGRDEWFVAGDNQLESIDSRNWAAPAGVPTRLIVGVVADFTSKWPPTPVK
ncbi:signal peptidase I [Botrimarina mediterranea]|uniref:Signal peptidase I n=1 Tax=Botrimarina mediterranea TaxID=2528022 RepID=A0A518K3S6_9BACT|nr:signal peptidase I [Botrimarina mediterranea]QDV72453.1 Signal peptidase I V [Botrimarina mediterranea]QDV77024.1 Signal peptidase I V [Planctomycetes bacterium K2D]